MLFRSRQVALYSFPWNTKFSLITSRTSPETGSRNWAVWLHEYLEDFPGKQDVLRYVLTANAPETKDNDFTWKDFQARNNNELVAVYGNFVNRAMVLTQKYFDSKVPACAELTDYDKETLKEFADVKAEVEKLLDVFKFRDAQKEADRKSTRLNSSH